MSRALTTSRRSTPGGVSSATGPATSVTRAPRRAAAAAIANPIRPELRLPRKRTGVDRLLGRARADDDREAGERVVGSGRAPEAQADVSGGERVAELLGLGHAARARLPAGLQPLGGFEHDDAARERRAARRSRSSPGAPTSGGSSPGRGRAARRSRGTGWTGGRRRTRRRAARACWRWPARRAPSRPSGRARCDPSRPRRRGPGDRCGPAARSAPAASGGRMKACAPSVMTTRTLGAGVDQPPRERRALVAGDAAGDPEQHLVAVKQRHGDGDGSSRSRAGPPNGDYIALNRSANARLTGGRWSVPSMSSSSLP